MKRCVQVLTALLIGMMSLAAPAGAQITTGNVAGTITDSQGGVLPGATVVLISESRGTKTAPVVTNETGDWVIPNVTPDTYTVEVTMPSFKTLKRTGVVVSGGDRVAVGKLALEVGGTSEVVDVTAEAPLIQAQSGERSFAVSTTAIANLPISHSNFANFTTLTPGVQGTTRLGGGGQNNIMMDGISAMDTGNNGQMLNMNIESIAEVKVLTQGYQAEFGRSSGLQITAVTKSGTNRFHGSGYELHTDSRWNANSWVNSENGDPKTRSKNDTLGYSLGGPVGKPGGDNKLFFFYSHEYRPTTSAINNGNPIRLRVPTAAERAGDFSQTLDNNGALFNLIHDPSSSAPCTSTNHAGCFQDQGILGKIPSSALYQPGISVMNRYPLPNVDQAPGTNYNYQVAPPSVSNLEQQPAIRADYQFSPSLRVTGKYSGDRARKLVTPGTIQGFNDVLNPYPFITNYAFTANYTISPTMFFEATYGMIRNQLAGGGSGGILVNPSSNAADPANGLTGLPQLYPDAGKVDQRYYAYKSLQDINPVWWDGTNINLPPTFGWGSRIGAAPPNQLFPGWLNINRTQDFATSLTKVAGHHTIKGGFYNNHSYKAQNTGAGGIANLSFQGFIDFGNNSNNPLDTGFGYSNAATGVFSQDLQQSNFIEGSMIYNNTEFYLQDNWKATARLTLDYGLRFTHQGPQYDQFGQMSNFFTDQWNPSQSQVLYTAGCSNGAATCSGTTRAAKDPRTGQLVSIPGVTNTSALIGTPIPGVGNPLNGIRQAGDGIANTGYTWPSMVYGPRFGAAYDISGDQKVVVRGGMGLFYDRPDGNTVFSIPGNPPIASSTNLLNGNLSNLGGGISPQPVPSMSIYEYNSKVPASTQWNAGVQMALPWASSLDVSYVGQHSFDRLAAYQAGNAININAVDFGTAYLPQYQDPTLAPSAVPGADAYTTNLLRPYQGLGTIATQMARFHENYHSIQTSFNRRFRNGVQFGVNYTLGLSYTGNTGLQLRLQHNPDGSYTVRDDQAAYEALNNNLDNRVHTLKASAVWDLPDLHGDSSSAHVIGAIVNDWQLSSVLTAGSAGAYDLGYSYKTGGGAVNLTGSPDYNARIVYTGDPGSGCSSDQFAQFNTASVTGPTYNSLGLESGRNVLRGCPDHTVDLAIARNFNLGGGRQFQVRLDAFNAFNVVVINGRNTSIQYQSPTDLTILNSETLADGSVDPNRTKPKNAGFGAATGAQAMRNLQLTARFSF